MRRNKMREKEKIRDKARNWTRLNEQRRDQTNNPDETRKEKEMRCNKRGDQLRRNKTEDTRKYEMKQDDK